MFVLLIETYRNGDARAVYQRVRETGRGIPTALRYVDSWVTEDLGRCYQIMEVSDPAALQDWMASWSDLVDFEVLRVIPSAEAARRALA
ncbi:MAG: DUF3303 family protein [Gemmatimonadota bacterium]